MIIVNGKEKTIHRQTKEADTHLANYKKWKYFQFLIFKNLFKVKKGVGGRERMFQWLKIWLVYFNPMKFINLLIYMLR